MTTEGGLLEQLGEGVLDEATGALSFVPVTETNQDSGDAPAQSTTAEPAQPAKEPATPAAPAAPDTFKERYDNLLPEFTRKSQELTELKAELALLKASGAKPAETPAEADPFADLDLAELVAADPDEARTKLRNAVKAQAELLLKPMLDKIAPVLAEQELEAELRNTIQQYPDFIGEMPKVRQVLSLDPTGKMTFEQAYQLVKKLAPASPAGSPEPKKEQSEPAVTPTPPTSLAPASGATREELERRAARPGSPADTGVAGTVTEPERKVTTVRDAFEKAVEQVLAGSSS